MTAPFVQLPAAGGADGVLIAGFAVLTALAGLFVASLAYRGSRRNDSRPMFYLAIGITLLTAVPVVANYALLGLTAASDAEILLVITAAHLAGVATVLYALTRA